MRFRDYCALQALNISSLLYVDRSPKHYKHYTEHGRPDSTTLAIGRAAHTGALEPHQFLREYALWPAENGQRRGKKYVAFATANAGKTILTEKEYDLAQAMASAVRTDPLAMRHLAPPGETEVTIQWEVDGRPAKSRIDFLGESIVDLKTCANASQRAFGRAAVDHHYDVRGAWYQDAVEHDRGIKLPVVFIAVEKTPPHDVVVWRAPDHVLEDGRAKYQELLETLRKCEERDEWPGQSGGQEQDLELPYRRIPNVKNLIINGQLFPV